MVMSLRTDSYNIISIKKEKNNTNQVRNDAATFTVKDDFIFE